MDRLSLTYQDTIIQFHASLKKHMPATPYQDFYLWSLSTENTEQKTWLQIIGIPQFAKLTVTLLEGLVSDEQWDTLMKYAAVMNNYLIYETVSDNLAIGLARMQPGDDTYAIRKSVLCRFNDAMALRLKGEKEQSQKLLDEIKADTEKISSFKQSLTEEEQRDMVKKYGELTKKETQGVEYGTWSALVANVESCVDVVDELEGHVLQDYLRQGLIARYEAVSQLLSHVEMTTDDLKRISTHSILVVPVLTYYVSVLAEIITPNSAISDTLKDNILNEALEDSALMVRLLNDLGTLLLSKEYADWKVFDSLYENSQQVKEATLSDFLLKMASTSKEMSRIHKDIAYGEYNISLYNMMDAPLTPEMLLLFGTNVVYFQECYQQCYIRLNKNLKLLTDILQTTGISSLILRFVKFHEYIYSYSFDSQAGDYATKPDKALVTETSS